MNRVQIPAYTDRWMMGDRYGDVVPDSTRWIRQPEASRVIPADRVETVKVKLDKSGKTVRVILNDCTVID